ncbi:DEAD/DEAH box helicase family protein [Haploplasma axanthum]|uniref:Hef nuclease n=1 Tax=Haploplasma axanthum TaxID=29552 RepID=A0A449BBT7_HAPAX|nr:DEAD/DEAH box helicase family protein [Haploplasma axanthum]VEU79905.1 Hef nuclease [Haploplasma axanthum]
MDDKIKKSLVDKSVLSFEYNPQILVNENSKNIKRKLIENLNDSNRIDIAVSYVVWSGLSLIYDHFKKFDKTSRLLITTEGLVTDILSLQKLLELDLSVKVYNPYRNDKGFHLKTYFFEKEELRTLIVGSNNISSRALGIVHEMAIEVDSSKDGYIVDKYGETFENLWNDQLSVDLTEDFILGYSEIYNEKMLMDEHFFSLSLDNNHIKPNYMQEKALVALEECRSLYDRGLVIAATGTGKTYLSAFDVRNSEAKKVLFLVHNRLILSSAIKTFKNIFRNKKVVELDSSNLREVEAADFIFTTDKTAYSYLYRKVSNDFFDYIIYDEAHKIGSETKYNELINYFTPKFTLGITATPERTDDPKHLFETFKYSIPYEIRLLDALNNELVCPFTYYGLQIEDKLLEDKEKFDYKELAIYIKKIIDEKGHYGEKLKGIVFTSNISEAIELSNMLNSEGIRTTAAVSGQGSFEDIENDIKSLESNDRDTLELICTVNKFNEGVDIPSINTIIMVRNTTSSIIYLQQLGRGLRRTFDPNKYVTVFDIIGNSKNNYSIAEVLTGNSTVDKRKLFRYANSNFETVSPFINVEIEKTAMENIIKSISNDFKVKTKIKNRFRDELYKYETIPTLKEMYNSKQFLEMDLLQLLHRNFYDPFDEYYEKKYNIKRGNKFIGNFLTLITQFVFRGYSSDVLKEYVALLRGNPSNDETLKSILLPNEYINGRSTSINSNYYKKGNDFLTPFEKVGDKIVINVEVIKELDRLNAIDLYKEHLELFEEISKKDSYIMKPFDLVDKGEFLFNVGAKDCYMNVVGERIDHNKKTVYCTIQVTDKKSFYDNYIVDRNRIIYYTQGSNTKNQAIEKVNKFVNEKYKFYICAQFPHLGYESTSYFNLGDVRISNISDVKTTDKGKYNHEIEFELETEFPAEFFINN